uniref:Csu631 n=1 Tax=Arundo donax TaxID=35708 RepID=A0A0A9DXV8_ARUDO
MRILFAQFLKHRLQNLWICMDHFPKCLKLLVISKKIKWPITSTTSSIGTPLWEKI